ncbi:MAG: DUF92 domain-containing protein [Halobacteriota archaeon]
MTSTLRRAGGFAAIATLALAAPALGPAAAAPFVAVALFSVFVVDDGPLFELFARPSDRRAGRLNSLAGFALAATALAVLATVPRQGMPLGVFVAAILVITYGELGARLVEWTTENRFYAVTGFILGAFFAAFAGQIAVAALTGTAVSLPSFAFLAASGALFAGLVRSVLYERDDPVVLLSIGLLLWLFDVLVDSVSSVEVAAALGVTVLLGYLSYVLGAASIPGMLTGVFLGLLTIVFGGAGWFAILISFFVVGALSTKFRYETKLRRGVAEQNEGARGSGNVLANSLVAMVAVLCFAAGPLLPVESTLFLYAFAGSLAAALSDTLSSEIGGLFDNPRLITTLEPVAPGTDGGITWQGELAGLVGAVAIALVSVVVFPPVTPALGLAIVALGGVVGMTADSVLGATLEGERFGNQMVNFLATFTGATASIVLAALLL